MAIHNRAFIVCLLVTALVALCGAAGQPQPGAASKPALAFSLHFAGGKGPPERSSGSLIAGWDDGVVVFAENPRKPGRQMLVGRVTGAQFARIMADLKEAGVFDSVPGGGVAPDASFYSLWASLDGKVAQYSCMWDPERFGTYSTAVSTDDGARRFARMWALSRVALSFAYPDIGSSRPLAQEPEIQRRLAKSGSDWYIEPPVQKR